MVNQTNGDHTGQDHDRTNGNVEFPGNHEQGHTHCQDTVDGNVRKQVEKVSGGDEIRGVQGHEKKDGGNDQDEAAPGKPWVP